MALAFETDPGTPPVNGFNAEPGELGGQILLKVEDSSTTTNGSASSGPLAVSRGGTNATCHGGVGRGGVEADIAVIGANAVITAQSESDGIAGTRSIDSSKSTTLN
jgi:hypothetical protein